MSGAYYIREAAPDSPWEYRLLLGDRFVELGGQTYTSRLDALEAWSMLPMSLRDQHRGAYIIGPSGGRHRIFHNTPPPEAPTK